MSSSTTAALIQSLMRPAAFPFPASKIDLIETHISWLLLAGEFAYKIKKPVKLGFVDFSSLDLRRFFCGEELRLNRRLAPDLYRDVLPIAGSPDSPRIGGKGPPIEYCVRMRRFDQDCLLSRVTADGKLLPSHIDQLARQACDFHARAPVADRASRFGTPESVAAPIRDNFRFLEGPENDSVRELLQRVRDWCENEIRRLDDFLLARKVDGFIRECHGDMHLGNMILDAGAITIFDCIEFNQDLRWIDVLSEIAFCTMDLDDRGRPDLSRRFLNACLECSGDYAGLAVVPLYLAYRALVRAKVAQLRRAEGGLQPCEEERLTDELRNYLELAERWTRRSCTFFAITHGLSGSGKTWGSQAVVERQGAIRIRSDLERKRLAGHPALADTGSRIGKGLYTPEYNARTFGKIAGLASAAILAGFPVIIDATCLQRAVRDEYRALAARMGVPFFILDFVADESKCRERMGRRRRDHVDASEATEEVLDRQLSTREPLSESERRIAITFDTEDALTMERALAQLDRRRSPIAG